jgi:O-antigen/teichoic acid export membrane protein
MAFTVAYSLYLVGANLDSVLVAEAANNPDRTEALTRQALRNATLLVVPLALLRAALGPLILRLLGRDYATDGTGLLRLLILSSIPYTIVVISQSFARIHQHTMA